MGWKLPFHGFFITFLAAIFLSASIFSFSFSLYVWFSDSLSHTLPSCFFPSFSLTFCGTASGLLHSGGGAGAGLFLWNSGGVWQRCEPVSAGRQPVQHPSAHTQVNPPLAMPTASSQHPGWYSYDSSVCHFNINPLKGLTNSGHGRVRMMCKNLRCICQHLQLMYSSTLWYKMRYTETSSQQKIFPILDIDVFITACECLYLHLYICAYSRFPGWCACVRARVYFIHSTGFTLSWRLIMWSWWREGTYSSTGNQRHWWSRRTACSPPLSKQTSRRTIHQRTPPHTHRWCARKEGVIFYFINR